MRQLTSFLECYKEKSLILQDSPNLTQINQIFLESEFNLGTELQANEPQYEERSKFAYHENTDRSSGIKAQMSQSGEQRGRVQPGNNVHNMNRHPKSICDLLRNPAEAPGQAFPTQLDYSETDQAPSQKVSNLWRDSQTDQMDAQRVSDLQRNTSQNIDALFDNNDSHLMGHKKNDFLNRIHYLNKEAQEQRGQESRSNANVFVNSDHLQAQKLNLMEQLSEAGAKDSRLMRPNPEEARRDEMVNPNLIKIKQAESFYEVDTGNRQVGEES